MVLEKTIFKINVFFLFRYHLPLEIGGTLNLSKHKFPLPKKVIGHLNWPFFRRRFKFSQMIFSYFDMNSPWKWAGVFIWTKLNPLDSSMLCAKFDSNWLSGSVDSEDFFYYFDKVFSPFYYPPKRAEPPFEQIWIPFYQECFVLSLVKIGPVVLERKKKMLKNTTTMRSAEKCQPGKLTWAFG